MNFELINKYLCAPLNAEAKDLFSTKTHDGQPEPVLSIERTTTIRASSFAGFSNKLK